MSGDPFPKEKQLSRGERRYHRKLASKAQWQRIIAAKIGPCRVCVQPVTNGATTPKLIRSASGKYIGGYPLNFHHIVPRDFHGDDVADNIAPLCFDCHELVTHRDREACRVLCASLTDAEYAYALQKCGESFFERAYGVTYGR